MVRYLQCKKVGAVTRHAAVIIKQSKQDDGSFLSLLLSVMLLITFSEIQSKVTRSFSIIPVFIPYNGQCLPLKGQSIKSGMEDRDLVRADIVGHGSQSTRLY